MGEKESEKTTKFSLPAGTHLLEKQKQRDTHRNPAKKKNVPQREVTPPIYSFTPQSEPAKVGEDTMTKV